MRRIGLPAIAGVAATAAIFATGCTGLHQAGELVGVNKQAQHRPALTHANAPYDDTVPFPPGVEEEPLPGGASSAIRGEARNAPGDSPMAYGSGQEYPVYGEPTCQAPFLREPTCEAPIWREPSCAGPGTGRARNGAPCGHGAGPCPCATCAKEQHVHEHVPAPQEEAQGCLSFGGGHISIPLPTVQLPGFFRVPAFRHALVPVAEATVVGVPTPVTEQLVSAPVVQQQLVSAPVTQQLVSAPVVQQQLVSAPVQQLVSAPVTQQLVPAQQLVSGAVPQGDCKRVAICEDEYQEYLRLKQQANGQQAAGGSPTPADDSAKELDALRSRIQQYESDIDEILKKVEPLAPGN